MRREVGKDERRRGGRRLRMAAAGWHRHPGPANWHSGADRTLRWLFKQVNWPGHQRERDRWMEGERREIWGQENVTREEGWSPGDHDDEERGATRKVLTKH